MKKEQINYYLDNSLIVRMIEEIQLKGFVELVEKERERACGLLTWAACVHLAVHNYFEGVD